MDEYDDDDSDSPAKPIILPKLAPIEDNRESTNVGKTQ